MPILVLTDVFNLLIKINMNKLYVNIMKLEKYFDYVIQERNTIYA